MDKIKKLQAAVSSGDPPQSPASTAPSAQVAVPGIANCAHAIHAYVLYVHVHMLAWMYIEAQCILRLGVVRMLLVHRLFRQLQRLQCPRVYAKSCACIAKIPCMEVTCMHAIYELPCMHACMHA